MASLESKKWSNTFFFSGHSLGEYSSLVCNNNMSFKNCLFLINKRSILMHNLFNKEKMEMFVLLDSSVNFAYFLLSKFINKHFIYISVLNTKNQLTFSIKNDSVKFIKNFLKGKKKLFFLNLKIGAHCSIFYNIIYDFKDFLIKMHYFLNKYRILYNLNINYCINKNFLVYIFLNHLCKKIDWASTLNYMEYLSVKFVFECGSGSVLKNFVNKTTNISCKKINNYYDFKKNLQNF